MHKSDVVLRTLLDYFNIADQYEYVDKSINTVIL